MTAMSNGATTVTRNCLALTVPQGEPIKLVAGDRVQITQTVGGSVTVRTAAGQLVRVDGVDADAVGLPRAERRVMLFGTGPFEMDRVTDALQTVYDPEIPVSIVELGLVYRCDEQIDDDGRRRIIVDMSMTAPGCGMGDVLRADAERVVRAVPGVDDVEVRLVWDPPWTIDRMSETARLELGML